MRSKFARRHSELERIKEKWERIREIREMHLKLARRHSESIWTVWTRTKPANLQSAFARHHNEGVSTRTKPAEGSKAAYEIRTAPQRERFDAHETRNFATCDKTSQGATARAFRSARNPQRVRRRRCKYARPHSERTKPAEGSPASFRIRTAPHRESFDTQEARRGLHPAYPRQTYPVVYVSRVSAV